MTSNNRQTINKFSEIDEYSVGDDNIVHPINNKNDTYVSENSETLKRYDNIFVKH